MNSKYSAKITGVGMYVPKKILTNKDIAKMVDTSDEWIRGKIGIKERRISGDGELPSDMSAIAAIQAIKNSGLSPEDIELIVLARGIPDVSTPATSAIIQKKIKAKNAAVFDIQNACQGFVSALIIASKFIIDGTYKNALVIGTCVWGKLCCSVNWRERTKSVFFGDGSGAAVLEKCNFNEGIISTDLGNIGEDSHMLGVPFGSIGSFFSPEKFNDSVLGEPMEGKEVFEFSTTKIPESIKRALKKIDLTCEDVDFVILHQANINIIKSIMHSLGFPMDKTFTNIDKYGNTSEASIPIALYEALQEGKIRKGDIVVLCGFGGGLGWATLVMKWV